MKRKLGNFAPDWPFCEFCKLNKADGMFERLCDDGTLVRKPICSACAFELGFALEEQFKRRWGRGR